MEGYRVSPEMIEQVRSGNWDPDSKWQDQEQKNAMAARGYYLALQVVKDSIISIFTSQSNDIVTLIIKDNGKGFPDTINLNKSGGFGLELVRILAEQLSADISFSNDNGAKVILKINQTSDKK